MQTTLELEDDVLAAAQELAQVRAISLGRAVSELARMGLGVRLGFRLVDGFPVFNDPPGLPGFGPDEVERAEEELYAEAARLFTGR